MTVPALAHLPEPDASDAGPYVVLVLLHAHHDRADELEARLLRQVEPARAEAGCTAYHLARDRTDPDKFYFFEAYTDVAAFRRHLDEDYNQVLLSELPLYLRMDPDVRFGSSADRFPQPA